MMPSRGPTPWERIKASELWDSRYNLPLIPRYANPWIYCAYVHRLVMPFMTAAERDEFGGAVIQYRAQCESSPGFIAKWPGDLSPTSHDELMGAAYLSPGFAQRAIELLQKSDGFYSTSPNPKFTDYVFRFIFLMPALKAFAEYRASLLSQALFGAHAIWSAYRTKEGDTSGILKIWLCAPAMRKFPLSRACLSVWESKWLGRGYTPRRIFRGYYLSDQRILGDLAKDDFS